MERLPSGIMAACLDASLTPNVKWSCEFFVDPRWRFLVSSIRLARGVTAPGGMQNPKASSSCILQVVLDVTAASKAGRGWSAGLVRAVAWVWRSTGILPACLPSLCLAQCSTPKEQVCRQLVQVRSAGSPGYPASWKAGITLSQPLWLWLRAICKPGGNDPVVLVRT